MITQYTVQQDDGTRFFETEDHLVPLPAQRTSSGSLTGMWEGIMRGLPQGDFPFTVRFQQEGEDVSGVLAFFFGGGAFKSSTLRNNDLHLRMDTPIANFTLSGAYRTGEISGAWSADDGSKGTWACKKGIEVAAM